MLMDTLALQLWEGEAATSSSWKSRLWLRRCVLTENTRHDDGQSRLSVVQACTYTCVLVVSLPFGISSARDSNAKAPNPGRRR